MGKPTDQNGLAPYHSLSLRTRPQLPPWVLRQDLTEQDLPYLHEFLLGSFEDWLAQANGFPWFEGPIRLFHPDGTLITAAGGTGTDQEPLPADWSRTVLGHHAMTAAFAERRSGMTRAAEHTEPLLQSWDCVAVPIFTRSTGLLCAVLAILLPAGTAESNDMKLLEAGAFHYKSCLYRRFEHLYLGGMLSDQTRTRKDESRRELLFEILLRLNDHMEVDQVLTEMLASLEELYPVCRPDLFLSQDNRLTSEKVQTLAFQDQGMELCKKAFLENEMCEQATEDRRILALPLSGKQGVYGVLRLQFPDDEFDKVDKHFLSRLAGAAGAAFEKAKLHEQSNAMVAELRLINELTKRLNSRLHKLQDTIEFASSQLLNIFHADYGWILQYMPAKNQFVIISSNVPELNGESFATDFGFIGIMWKTKEPVILSEYGSAESIDSRVMSVTNSRSLLAAPLIINGEMIGAVILSHREPNHFSYDNYKLMEVLSVHLGLAVTNASSHAEVRRMVITDNVTGLYSRNYLNERISRRLKRDGSGSLILMDIDHFKRINDTFGHQAGDNILLQVSEIIRSSIRDGDIPARWGGEELAVYLPHMGLEQAVAVAKIIRERVEAETDPQVTVSSGVSEWSGADEKVSVESLFYKADMALYEAKRHGRNRVEFG
jgi:diguanylate cyclase (GGDEF)-like protein